MFETSLGEDIWSSNITSYKRYECVGLHSSTTNGKSGIFEPGPGNTEKNGRRELKIATALAALRTPKRETCPQAGSGLTLHPDITRGQRKDDAYVGVQNCFNGV